MSAAIYSDTLWGEMSAIRVYKEYVCRSLFPSLAELHSEDYFASAEVLDIVVYDRNGESRPQDPIAPFDDALRLVETIENLRQSMLNLVTVGLYHLFEQQLFKASKRWNVVETTAANTNITDLRNQFLKRTALDLKSLPGWASVYELSVLANVVKHGDGASGERLRELNSALLVPHNEINTLLGDSYVESRVYSPLSGNELFPTEAILHRKRYRSNEIPGIIGRRI